MKILLDLQACQAPLSRNRGIGRYSFSLAKAMVHAAPQHEFWLLLNGAYEESAAFLAREFEFAIPANHIVTFSPIADAQEVGLGRSWCARAGERIRQSVIERIAPDAVHVSSLFEGASDQCIVSVPGKPHPVTAVTLYDLIPLLNADRYLSNPDVRRWYGRKLESLARADVLLGISESASQEARETVELHSCNIVTISSAVDRGEFHEEPLPASSASELADIGLTKPFVMYTGGIDWRKNIEGLIAAYAALPRTIREKRQLALVCHAEDSAKKVLLGLASSLGLSAGDLVLTGFVTDASLKLLYRSCELFVFPSIHEGFGLPALEAMCCGAPVIGSNRSSIPEVIGRADAMFDPTSVEQMSAVMKRALTDAAFRDELAANGRIQANKFSWDVTARRALGAIEEAVDRRTALTVPAKPLAVRPAKARPTMAMVTPMLPLRSGIADYCSELLPVLREHYEITAICDRADGLTWKDGDAPVPVRGVDWFREHAHTFDRIVYQFGNSEYHAHMFALLREFPGAVVLHDFFLSGVLSWMERTGYAKDAFTRSLARSHGHSGIAYVKKHGIWKAMDRFPCNRFVLERATGVIVHSQYAVRMAELLYGKSFPVRWAQIPHLRVMPANVDRNAARAALGLGPDDFLVCTFGFVAPSKMNERLLSAWKHSQLASDLKCRLVFVGHNEPGAYGKTIDKAIAAMPISKQVTITGFASRKLFETYLCASDLAVQLRTQSRGETSGAVLDCLAHGVPVILNANGPMAEYPDDVVDKLNDDFSDEELAAALDRMRTNVRERTRLSGAGRALISSEHDPQLVARAYRDALETFATHAEPKAYWGMLRSLAEAVGPASEEEMIQATLAVLANEHLI